MSNENENYVGAIVVDFNATEYDAVELQETVKNITKVVKTMNRKNRAKGRVKLVPEFSLEVTVAIPLSGEPNWLEFDNGKISYESIEGGKRITFQGCCVTEMSGTFKLDGEAVRKLSVSALNRIEE